MSVDIESHNFQFLAAYDPQFVRLGTLAERYFRDDPNTCLIKLRQFGELLAQEVAARVGFFASADEPQSDLLRRLKAERAVPPQAMDLFHQIRVTGNQAAHARAGDHSQALTTLKIARQLAVWFHRTFGRQPGFKPGPFAPPPEPVDATASLREELDRLQTELAERQSAAELAREEAQAAARARESAEVRARRESAERQTWEQLAQEAEDAKLALARELAALQEAAQKTPPREKAETLDRAEEAARAIDLDEASTRAIIDRQLRERGWTVDSKTLRYASGARPARGQAMAIAEWPTASGPADYALFIGTQLIAVVEAKRRNKNVSAAIDQAERYSKGFKFDGGAEAIGGPWGDYRAPFVFSANGRPYLKQLETESGIWFRDARSDTNRRRALVDWFTPDGLKAEFETDRDAAQEALKTQPFEFGFPLRPYQRAAIEKVEEALAIGPARDAGRYGDRHRQDQARHCAALPAPERQALPPRLLRRGPQRARRADRRRVPHHQGRRAARLRRHLRPQGARRRRARARNQGAHLHHPGPGEAGALRRRASRRRRPSTSTISWSLMSATAAICSTGSCRTPSSGSAREDDYISKYRRVLEHFDAVKIGLTATPALHTVQIFGNPIYTYSYREAVIDGYLIDHEPPVRIKTALAQAGIKFKKR